MVKLSDFPKTCRLCSKVYRVEKLVKIFSDRGTSLNLKESLNAHLPIKIAETETTMPQSICINCIRKLNSTNEFFTTVITSDKLFKRLLKKKEKLNSNTLCLAKEKQVVASPKNPEEPTNQTKMPLKSKNRYVNIVPKASHVVLGNGSCNGNILFSASVKDQHKLAIEVLRCPDCKETAKIFSVEERQLFFEYLKQHRCGNKGVESVDGQRIDTFAKYIELYAIENTERDKKRSEGKESKTHCRMWPEGDLPADPGPDPSICEDIFEDDVRLDDDFYWPMPKRIRRLHKCGSCDFVTKSAMRLKSHQKLHRNVDKRQTHSGSNTCRHCNKRFESVNEAKKHERLAHVSFGAKNSLCEYCGVIKPQKTLRDHVLKQHTVESEIEMQSCDVCGKSYVSQCSISFLHFRDRMKGPPCKVNGSRFISPSSLYLHKKIHTIEKQYLCDLCGKAFKQRIAMRRHYMLHSPRAPPKFKCNICEKRVTTRGSLRLHMMRHTGEKPQECPECHMVMRHGLKHHMRLHSDESPFKCVVCGADFKRRDYVRRHMRKHLNETNHGSLRCNICEHVFDDIKNFLIHHQNVHNNEIFTQIKIYECKSCSMQFADGLQHKDHQSVCKNSGKETECRNYDQLQSCIMISHPKVDGIEDHKDCPKKIASDRSYPCVYCDYKETNNRGKDDIDIDSESGSIIKQQSRLNVQRLKRHEMIEEHQNSEHVILSDDVMSLGTESSEYSYINIIEKSNLRDDKDHILMSVDEQISVHVFDNPVDQFVQSQQSHLGLHSHNETYTTREALSWKQL